MTGGPLDRVIGFWKPALSADELRDLAAYRAPGTQTARGIDVLTGGGEPQSYTVIEPGARFRMFAAVHPVAEVPPGSESLAEIVDMGGAHHSFVLRDPGTGSILLPFDPSAAVDAFRREEYVPVGERSALPKPVLAAYYAVKSLIPRAVRRRLRRSMARKAMASQSALDWPLDESADMLQRFMLRLIMIATDRRELQFAWFWPDGHPWAVVLTHDVETADGLARVPHVADLERARGLRSSFNMVPHDYDVSDSLVSDLGLDGFEVGVHGYTHDGLLFSNRAVFDARAVAIKEAARRWGAAGFRSPATYRNPEWLPLLGLEYDSSYSNTAPCEPQPGGCASFFPFPLDGMTELPITLPQDHTLFELLEQTDASTWLACLDRIRRSHGMACVLAHPDRAPGYVGMPENEARYAEVLDAVAASDAWTPLPRQLAMWWRRRGAQVSADGSRPGTAVLDLSGEVRIVPPERGPGA